MLDNLKKEAKKLSARIDELRAMPHTRESAVGGMIPEKWVLQEWEDIDKELGKINAEIIRLTDTTGTKIYYIYYSHNHIIKTVIKNGILVEGGLLNNYFKGRAASEHKNYVEDRHSKRLTETTVEVISVSRDGIEIKIKLNDAEFLYNCVFHFPFRINEGGTFFQIRCDTVHIKRLDRDRGASEHQLNIIKYVAATTFQEKFYPKQHINLVG